MKRAQISEESTDFAGAAKGVNLEAIEMRKQLMLNMEEKRRKAERNKELRGPVSWIQQRYRNKALKDAAERTLQQRKWAASVIQSRYYRFAGRRQARNLQAHVLNSAVLWLQTRYRGKKVSSDFKEEERVKRVNARMQEAQRKVLASKIQNLIRAGFAKDEAQMRYVLKAVMVIQARYRGRKYRVETLEALENSKRLLEAKTEASLYIQNRYRGKDTKKRILRNRRDTAADRLVQDAAAHFIQARVRRERAREKAADIRKVGGRS